MERNNNHFEMFGLPISYEVDAELLNQRYLALQRQFHPDRYAHKSAQEQRLAVQYTADLNQAYAVVKSPLLRARYLLSLAGIDDDSENGVTRDVDFLMQQMALREALAEVSQNSDPFAELEHIQQQVRASFEQLKAEFAASYQSADYSAATETVAKLQFFSKLLGEAEQLEHDLDAE